jgi:hypothetical protein
MANIIIRGKINSGMLKRLTWWLFMLIVSAGVTGNSLFRHKNICSVSVRPSQFLKE